MRELWEGRTRPRRGGLQRVGQKWIHNFIDLMFDPDRAETAQRIAAAWEVRRRAANGSRSTSPSFNSSHFSHVSPRLATLCDTMCRQRCKSLTPFSLLTLIFVSDLESRKVRRLLRVAAPSRALVHSDESKTISRELCQCLCTTLQVRTNVALRTSRGGRPDSNEIFRTSPPVCSHAYPAIRSPYLCHPSLRADCTIRIRSV